MDEIANLIHTENILLRATSTTLSVVLQGVAV